MKRHLFWGNSRREEEGKWVIGINRVLQWNWIIQMQRMQGWSWMNIIASDAALKPWGSGRACVGRYTPPTGVPHWRGTSQLVSPPWDIEMPSSANPGAFCSHQLKTGH